uniref:Uncharacterized protein n=1 Tax=Sphaerodactylus townsendi TaxID=933632 RepID=A0ACB8EZE6_9SAUR
MMKGLLLIAVLAVAYSLGFGAEVPVQPNFDPQQFAGKWYAIGIVNSNGPPEHIPVLDHTVETLPNGDLLIRTRTQVPEKNKCKKKNIHLTHSDHPGVFTTATKHIFTVVEAEYGSYYILYIETPEKNILQFFARKPEVPIMMKSMYLSHVQSLGFKRKFVLYLNIIAQRHMGAKWGPERKPPLGAPRELHGAQPHPPRLTYLSRRPSWAAWRGGAKGRPVGLCKAATHPTSKLAPSRADCRGSPAAAYCGPAGRSLTPPPLEPAPRRCQLGSGMGGSLSEQLLGLQPARDQTAYSQVGLQEEAQHLERSSHHRTSSWSLTHE